MERSRCLGRVCGVTFTLLPAVDVADGQAVRPVQGKLVSGSTFGAEWIHLVDLHAAFSCGSNAVLLASVIEMLDANVQLPPSGCSTQADGSGSFMSRWFQTLVATNYWVSRSLDIDKGWNPPLCPDLSIRCRLIVGVPGSLVSQRAIHLNVGDRRRAR
jgi:hypothetical protein